VVPAAAHACEPILPLVQLFSGTLLYPGAVVLLGGTVLLKALAFALFEKRLKWHRAIVLMLVANVLSSLIGLCLSLSAAVPTALLLFLPVVFALSVVPAGRLIAFNPWGYFGGFNRFVLAGLVVVLFVATWVLFGLAQEVLESQGSLTVYWLLKFLYVYTALLISIGLTTMWEEWVVAGLARDQAAPSFLPSVLKANLVTFAVVVTISAAMMLPARLRAHDFLVLLR